MNTTRRYPRTTEEAFGPHSWPISGPYRRSSRALRNIVVGMLAMLGAAALLLGAIGMAAH